MDLCKSDQFCIITFFGLNYVLILEMKINAYPKMKARIQTHLYPLFTTLIDIRWFYCFFDAAKNSMLRNFDRISI